MVRHTRCCVYTQAVPAYAYSFSNYVHACTPAFTKQLSPCGEGWESHRAGPLRELFHVRLAGGRDSSAGGNAEPRLRQCVMACHHCVPQRAAYEGVGATGCHETAADTRIVFVLTCAEIFAEAQACTEADSTAVSCACSPPHFAFQTSV